jgi:AcrR family transcriptional regulator
MAERREDILKVVRSIIAKKGMAGLSTTEICKVAGISMGALYTHFSGKNEIILALAEWTTENIAKLYDFHDAKEMRERLMNLAGEAKSDPTKFRLDVELAAASLSDPKLGRMWQSFRESKFLAISIARLVRVGELRRDLDAETAATAIEALLLGLYFVRLVGGKRGDPAEAMALLLDDMMPRKTRR